jgi:hypothetical protein
MTELADRARPVRSCRAGLDAVRQRFLLAKPVEHFPSDQLLLHDNVTLFVDAVKLKRLLCNVETNCCNALHGRPHLLGVCRDNPYCATRRRKKEAVHPIMPAVLKPEAWPVSLGEQPAAVPPLKALLAPYPSEDMMICWPVSARVGNVKNNDPTLIERIAAASPSVGARRSST